MREFLSSRSARQEGRRSSSSARDTGVNVSGIRRAYSVLGVLSPLDLKGILQRSLPGFRQKWEGRGGGAGGPIGCQVAGPTRDQLRVLTVGRLARRFWPGCDDGKKTKKQNKNLSIPAVLSSCKNVMERKKKLLSGQEKQSGSRDG